MLCCSFNILSRSSTALVADIFSSTSFLAAASLSCCNVPRRASTFASDARSFSWSSSKAAFSCWAVSSKLSLVASNTSSRLDAAAAHSWDFCASSSACALRSSSVARSQSSCVCISSSRAAAPSALAATTSAESSATRCSRASLLRRRLSSKSVILLWASAILLSASWSFFLRISSCAPCCRLSSAACAMSTSTWALLADCFDCANSAFATLAASSAAANLLCNSATTAALSCPSASFSRSPRSMKRSILADASASSTIFLPSSSACATRRSEMALSFSACALCMDAR
mmetsp:Transcript_105469/g.264083  ORF Transcript_105469/g.264083 Transcript_105469/m.264083 type:complete len:288 (-) Transcript_105469:1187-2050(-)